jgi:hypothetical protein
VAGARFCGAGIGAKRRRAVALQESRLYEVKIDNQEWKSESQNFFVPGAFVDKAGALR